MCALLPGHSDGRGVAPTANGVAQPLARGDPTNSAADIALGVAIPPGAIARDASELAQAAMPATLFNHCLRTYVLAMRDAQRRGLTIDRESGFVAAILHDLALVASHAGDPAKSFEDDGHAPRA